MAVMLALFIICCGGAVLCWFGITFFLWISDCGDYPRIKFRSFQRFYMLYPCRWELEDTTVHYLTDSWRKERFAFSFFDVCRYSFFCARVGKDRRRAEQARALGVVAKCVQADIDKTKKLAELELEKAKTIIGGVGKP